MGVSDDGYPSFTELKDSRGIPSERRMEEGPVAFIECVQNIPCDPCEWVCSSGAIQVGENITALPRLIEERCNGCGACIAACPGQAIFVVHANYSETETLVTFPYEFVPLPREGDIVTGVNREGMPVTVGRVIKVRTGKALDHTAVISLAIPKEFAWHVRSIMIEF